MTNEQTSQVSAPELRFVGIGTAISEGVLRVPQYQRDFAWEADHVQDLFTDIASAIGDKEEHYFLGSIVTVRTNASIQEVVDGQQRLATITILLAAIRDYFYSTLGDTEISSDLESKFLKPFDRRRKGAGEQRLFLNARDNSYFRRRVLSLPDDPERINGPTRAAEERIDRAAQLARDRVANIVLETKDPESRLLDWVEFIEQSVKVIWFSVTDYAGAFVIFETLNDRGLELTISDLLKNHLFSRAGNNMKEAESHWLSVITALEGSGNQELIVDYIRSYWSSIHGLTRKDKLFDEIKASVANQQKAVSLTQDLATGAKLYVAMLSGDDPYWDKFDIPPGPLSNAKVRSLVRTFSELRLDRHRTLLLAVLRKFSDLEIVRTLEMLVGWTVRFIVVGSGGGTLEKKYPEVAARVSDGSVTTARALYDNMSDIVPTDQRFKELLSTYEVSRAYVARYLLRTIENSYRPESPPTIDTQVVNLEHILPDGDSKNWDHFSAEDKASYRNRLGNLTLLGTRMNSKLKDASFDKKREEYKKNPFEITKGVIESVDWTVEAIQARQKLLAERAPSIWPARPRGSDS